MKTAWCVGLVAAFGSSVPVEAIDPFRMAFVTSVQGGAVLGDASDWPDNDGLTGIAAADAICRNRAFAGGLLGWDRFRAWISTGVHDAYCRVHDAGGTIATNCGQPVLPTGAGPWIRVDGLPWAARIDDALGLDGVVYRPLLDEFGNDFPIANVAASVWTGTGPEGAGTGEHCGGWTTTTGSAASGQPGNATTQNWGFNWGGGCSANRALLCLQTGPGPDIPIGVDTGRLAFQTSARGTGELGT